MFDIKVNIQGAELHFGTFKYLYLEMQYTNTDEVIAECSYCFQRLSTVKLTLADVELLASDKLLDKDIIKTIEDFVRASKALLGGVWYGIKC